MAFGPPASQTESPCQPQALLRAQCEAAAQGAERSFQAGGNPLCRGGMLAKSILSFITIRSENRVAFLPGLVVRNRTKATTAENREIKTFED